MKRVVLCDMDGVLADLVSTWLAAYNTVTGEALTPADVHSYHWADVVKDPETFYTLLADESLFYFSPQYKSHAGLETFCQNPAFDLHIVSYVHHSSTTGHVQKLEWLEKHMPYFNRDKVTFTKQKHLVRGDILIEDSPDNIDAWTEANPNGHAICIRAAYNANWHPKHSTRVTMAEDVSEAVRNILRSYT